MISDVLYKLSRLIPLCNETDSTAMTEPSDESPSHA